MPVCVCWCTARCVSYQPRKCACFTVHTEVSTLSKMAEEGRELQKEKKRRRKRDQRGDRSPSLPTRKRDQRGRGCSVCESDTEQVRRMQTSSSESSLLVLMRSVQRYKRDSNLPDSRAKKHRRALSASCQRSASLRVFVFRKRACSTARHACFMKRPCFPPGKVGDMSRRLRKSSAGSLVRSRPLVRRVLCSCHATIGPEPRSFLSQ